MVRAPRVVGLVLCKSLSFLPPGGKPSLIDVFHALRFRHFPSPQLNFTVYFALYDGVGEGIMELTTNYQPVADRRGHCRIERKCGLTWARHASQLPDISE